MSMPNIKPFDPPLSSVTQGILWLGKNGTYKGNHITTTSLKSSRLYTLICKSYNILTNWQHIIGMVIPGMLILKNLIMSWPRWTSRRYGVMTGVARYRTRLCNHPHKTTNLCMTSSNTPLVSDNSHNLLVCHQDVCGRCCQEQTQRRISEWSSHMQTNACTTLEDTFTSYSSHMLVIQSKIEWDQRQ